MSKSSLVKSTWHTSTTLLTNSFFGQWSYNVSCIHVCCSTGRRCLRSAARTSRSDDAQNDDDDLWIMQFCSLQTTCLEWSATDFAFIIHQLGQFQSRLKTTLFHLAYGMWLGLRGVTWLFRPLELALYKCSNLLTYLLTVMSFIKKKRSV